MTGRPRGILALACLLVGPGAAGGELGDRVVRDAARGPLVAHVFVALCDNRFQGIVPVPAHLGNGQDPAGNLYWGARYGVRTYLTREAGWTPVAQAGPRPPGVLERSVFVTRLRGTKVYLVADAWDGSRIAGAIEAFLASASGRGRESLTAGGVSFEAGGQAHLVAFVGHNGLMDFAAPVVEPGTTAPPRGAMVLACASKPYFAEPLRRSGAQPLLLTTGLMAPEAYTLDAAVRAWFATLDPEEVRSAAAAAYSKHQRCGLAAARRLFVSAAH
jgi:hypothetical protein